MSNKDSTKDSTNDLEFAKILDAMDNLNSINSFNIKLRTNEFVKICNQIIQLATKSNSILNQEIFDMFCDAILTISIHDQYDPLKYNFNTIHNTFKLFIEKSNVDWTDEQFKQLVKKEKIKNMLDIYLRHRQHLSPSKIEIFKEILIDKASGKNNYGTLNYYIAETLISHNIYDDELIEIICELYYKSIIEQLIKKKVKFTQKCLHEIIKNGSVELCNSLLSLGCDLDTRCLEIACEHRHKNMIQFLLENKIIPNKICLQLLLKKSNNNNQNRYRRRRYYYRNRYNDNLSSEDDSNSDEITTLIDLFVNVGYKLDYEDLLLITQNKVKINNFENLNIKIDEKFADVCNELGFYPYPQLNIKPSIIRLQKECEKSNNLTKIKNLITEYNLKPNVVCLRNACKLSDNRIIIKYLIDLGIEPDEECVKNIGHATGLQYVSYVIDNYFESMKKKQQIIPKDETNETNEPIETNELKEPIIATKNTNKTKSNSDKSDKDDSNNGSDEDQSSKKKIILKKSVDKKIKNTKGKKNKESDSEEHDIENFKLGEAKKKKEVSKNQLHELHEIPESYDFRKEIKIDDQIVKLLSLGKNNMLSFIAFRQEFNKYLTKHNLIHNGTINMDDNLKKICGKYASKEIELEKLDDLLYNVLHQKSLDEIDTKKKDTKKRYTKQSDLKNDEIDLLLWNI